MKIVIAGDHYTVELMKKVAKLLETRSIEFSNLGSQSAEQKISLQKIILAVAHEVQNNIADFGILACGTGVGVEIGANRFNGVRASLC